MKIRLMKRRITRGRKDWHIAIDDGFTSYLFKLNASGKYSINSLFRKIQKSIKKNPKNKTSIDKHKT